MQLFAGVSEAVPQGNYKALRTMENLATMKSLRMAAEVLLRKRYLLRLNTTVMSKLALGVLFVLATGSVVCAQSVALTTVNTDPLWNTNVFNTNPPVLANDLRFSNNIGGSGTTCYLGSTATDSNCYQSALSGSLTIMNQSASDTFAGLILMATFAGTPTNLSGTVGSENISLNSSQFSYESGRVMGGGTSAALTNQYNSGDFAYIFIRMSDYFGGVNCGSNPNGAGCVLGTGQSVVIPYSFVDLPANVIFNVYGVATNETISETNPNSSTSGVLAGIAGGGGGSSVPEPATMFLLGSGVLTLLRLRSRASGAKQAS
jgi:hypothetical protein